MKFFTGKTVVIGATDNTQKFGYKIFKRIQEITETIPVNPKKPIIDGVQSVASFTEVDNIDTLVFVVRPSIGLPIVQEALRRGITKFWFQPGSYDESIMQPLEGHAVDVSYGACVLQL